MVLVFYVKTTYPFQKFISEKNLVGDIQSRIKFCVVDCSFEVPEHLREKFIEFPPFKRCEVGLQDIGSLMKDFSHEHNLLKEPTRMLISSCYLQRRP